MASIKSILEILENCGQTDIVLDFDGIEDIPFAVLRRIFNMSREGCRISVINASENVVERFEDSGVGAQVNVARKPRRLDFSRYSEFGGGFLSTAYNSDDGDSMLKIYGDNVPYEAVLREKNLSKAVLLFGINTPMPGRIYEYNGRKCIDFERIEGKRSLSRIMSEEPERIEEMSVKFAHMCRHLHSTPCDTSIFPEKSAFYRGFILKADSIDGVVKENVLSFLDSVPPQTTCLHGDMQPSNVITNGKEDFWIDLADFSYGNHLFDLGMWYFLSNLNPEELCQHIFHLSHAQMLNIWDIFIREYFGASTPSSKEEVRRQVEPYAALHMLYLGTAYGFRPGMTDFIEKIFR